MSGKTARFGEDFAGLEITKPDQGKPPQKKRKKDQRKIPNASQKNRRAKE